MRCNARFSLLCSSVILFSIYVIGSMGSARAEDRTGVSAKTVEQIQIELKQKGFYDGEIDGRLGPKTREGLRRYQKEKGLSGNGRLTEETAHSLGMAKSGDATPGEHFEGAGTDIKEQHLVRVVRTWEQEPRKPARTSRMAR